MIGDAPRILAAVAAASIETGAPIMVHTNAAARTGLDALEVLTGHGVRPERIVIAHAGDSNDFMIGDPAFANENPDYLLISDRVLPARLNEGVTQTQIDELMVANPRRFLTGGERTPAADAAGGHLGVEPAR